MMEPTARVVTIGSTVTREKWTKSQEDDQTLGWIVKAKQGSNVRPDWSEITSASPTVRAYWLCWDQIEIKDGLLCKRWESDDGRRVRHQVIVPKLHREELVSELHGGQTGGHLGQKKTLAKVRQRFYWAGMSADVRSFVRQCDTCASKKSPAKARKAPLQQYAVGAPMQRVALDILGPLPETERGNKYILVIGDYFSKWVEAYPVPDEKAETVAQKLVTEFVCRLGVPVELHSDQGRNFESRVFAEMCEILGIKKTRTTPYNPKSDGMIERFNRTLIAMVSVMIEPHKRQRDWDEKVALATFAYRASPHESTGETPNMLMLGREVFVPLDLTTPVISEVEEVNATSDFAYRLREGMQLAHERAREHLRHTARRQKRYYDRKTCTTSFNEGQFVWLYNPSKKKGLSPKLQRRWEGPYLIIKKLSDVTYRIQSRQRGKKKVVHFDRLKPYTGKPLETWGSSGPYDEAPCQVQRHQADTVAEGRENVEVLMHTPSEGIEIDDSEREEGLQATKESVQAASDVATTPVTPYIERPTVGRRNPQRQRRRPQRFL